MASAENKLLSKWSASTGGQTRPQLSSSLLTSSLASGLTTIHPASPPRKRKPLRGSSAEAADKKKSKDLLSSKSSLTSNLLLSSESRVPLSAGSSLTNSISLNLGTSLLCKQDGQISGQTSSPGGSAFKSCLPLTSAAQDGTKHQSASTSSLRTGKLTLSLRSKSFLSHSSAGSSHLLSGSSSMLKGNTNVSSGTSHLSLGLSHVSMTGSGSLGSRSLTNAGGISLTSGLLSNSSLSKKEGENKIKLKGTKTETKENKGKKRKLNQRYKAPPPKYDLSNEIEEKAEMVLPKFIPPERDRSLLSTGVKLHDVNGMKFALVNAVSGSLICQPNFSLSNDPTRVALVRMSEKVIAYDPEFILKLALYTRKQLNIRTTGNFLLALSSHIPACRPYLRRYFNASIALPSDWIEVAEIYQAFPEKTLPLGSLPSALRRAMMAKFPDFDKYQLAKYNKESSKKKKKKKAKTEDQTADTGTGDRGRGRGRGAVGRGRAGRGRGRGRGRGGTTQENAGGKGLFDSDSSSSEAEDSEEEMERAFRKHQENLEKGLGDVAFDEEETPERLERMSFTLKQLIRKLHITEPVEHVMCLIGKKYPGSLEEFYRSRLPGTFEEERSGKRMKLPVPETWETQVSLKGNKASTWQDLIDHKKLPFMAMLRNLRNLIKAGISQKHHNWVLRKLTDERSVIFSKQFPFRFFSAYEVLEQLQKDYEKSQAAIVSAAEKEAENPGGRGRGRGQGRGRGAPKVKLTSENWWIEKRKRKQEKNKETKETPYDTALINRYRKALDTAVKLATVYNVQPIRGRTIILCDRGANMAVPCTAARGLGKPRTMLEVSILLGLMCKHSCEDSSLIVFDSHLQKCCPVEVEKGTILDNMARVQDIQLEDVSGAPEFQEGLPVSVLKDCIRDRTQVDNLVLLTGGSLFPGQRSYMAAILDTYRRLVNPNLLYVNVSFAGKSCGFDTSIQPEHDNNIYISGFSDQILRFIAERGDGGQLRHIEKIDEAFNLKPLPAVALDKKPTPPTLAVEKPLPLMAPTPSWRTGRVFISSTFRDMHGERDLLTRFVFPELRALGKHHFINVYEVDLRWGVTEEDTRSNKTLELCLSEITRCQLFVGILGERYGWVSDKYLVPDTPEFDWVREYPPGASITELEMYSAALAKPAEMKDRAFFFLRDRAFESDVPKAYQEDFLAENQQSAIKMAELKQRILRSGLEVFENYPCEWAGVVDDKPLVSRLEEFGSRALNNLWNALRKLFPDQDAILDEFKHSNSLHEAYAANLKALFVGRKKIIKDTVKLIPELKSGVIALAGKPGTGKSSLLASLLVEYMNSKACDSSVTVVTHFVGAAPGSANILATLRRLCHELNTRFCLEKEIPEDYKNLVVVFEELLQEAGSLCASPLVLFFDGLDSMDPAYLPHNLDWLPAQTPQNVVVVFTCITDGKVHVAAKRQKVTEVVVEGLDMWDKAEVVRCHLATHRKSLDESSFNNQMKLLVSKKDAAIPLYLSIACEELRVYGLFEKVTQKLKTLPQTVPLLLQEVLTRIEMDVGKETVQAALCLLLFARDGLEAEELHNLLSLHGIMGEDRPGVSEIVNIQPSPALCLPAATFAQLQRALQGVLNPAETWTRRLRLTHADIENAVKQRYLKTAAAVETELFFHRLLAGYFFSQADPQRDRSWRGKSSRAFQELPYHLRRSGSFKELEGILCDLQFIYSKCMLGLAAQLLEDYQSQDFTNKTLEREQAKIQMKQSVLEYQAFVARNLHILTSHPALTWQQAYNESASSCPARDVRALMSAGTCSDLTSGLMEWASRPDTVDPCFLTLSNLPQPITSVAVSDNRYFACGGLDCQVYLYDIMTGREVRTYRGHSDAVTDVCFAGIDKLCSASKDTTVCVWDVEGGHRLFTLKGHMRQVNSCSSDPSGKLVATASWDCTIRVWSTKKGEQLCEFKVGSPVNCVSFHPEGQLIVSGQWDSTIKIWDVFHKTKKAVLRGHLSSVRDVAYSPTGRHIASAAMDGDVKLWAAYAGSQVGNIRGHALPINKLVFSPTGNELITVSDDHKIKVWSGHLGKPVHCLGSKELGPAMSVAIAPSRETVAVGYHSGLVKIYDLLSGSELSSRSVHAASVRCIRFLSAQALLTASDDNSAKILSTKLKELGVMSDHHKPVMSVDSCAEFLATASEDCSCRLYDNPFKYSTKTLGVKSSIPTVCVLGGHIAPVTTCCFNSDGSRLATASRDMSVRIWDVVEVCLNADSPSPLTVLADCHADWVTDCRWSNTGDFLVTSSTDFNLKVWDMKTNKEKFTLTGHMGAVNHVGYMYGCIVSTCTDGSVKVWSHKGVEITTLYGHTQRSNGCDILVSVADDKTQETEDQDWANSEETEERTKVLQPRLENVMVASAGDDGTVRLWYPLQANELSCLTGHSDKVLSVAADTRGKHVVTSSLDRTVKVWKNEQDSSTVGGSHDAPVTFITSTQFWSGELVLTGSRDGICKIWENDPSTGAYRNCLTMQTHERAVTCGCWQTTYQFVTGSDDGSIAVWRVFSSEGKPISLENGCKVTSIRKQRTLSTDSPVVGMASSGPGLNSLIFTIHWDGCIRAWNTGGPGLVTSKQTLFSFPCWPQSIKMSSNHCLLVTTTQASVYTYNVADLIQASSKDGGNRGSIRDAEAVAFVGDADTVRFENIPDHKVPANWVLAVTGGYNDFITGDSRGQVSRAVNSKTRKSVKVHSDEVTCMVMYQSLIFTASRDLTIKVWNSRLIQVGQFFCQSPVTSLHVLKSSTSNCVAMVASDELGLVHFLNWRTG